MNENFSTFQFDIDKVINFYNSLESPEEQLKYLEWVKKEGGILYHGFLTRYLPDYTFDPFTTFESICTEFGELAHGIYPRDNMKIIYRMIKFNFIEFLNRINTEITFLLKKPEIKKYKNIVKKYFERNSIRLGRPLIIDREILRDTAIAFVRCRYNKSLTQTKTLKEVAERHKDRNPKLHYRAIEHYLWRMIKKHFPDSGKNVKDLTMEDIEQIIENENL